MCSQTVSWLFIIAACYVHTTLADIKVEWKSRYVLSITGLPPFGKLHEGHHIEVNTGEHIYLGQEKMTHSGAHFEFIIGEKYCVDPEHLIPARCIYEAAASGRTPIDHFDLQKRLNDAVNLRIGSRHYDNYWPMKLGGQSRLKSHYEIDRDKEHGGYQFLKFEPTPGAILRGERVAVPGGEGDEAGANEHQQPVDLNLAAEGQAAGQPLIKRQESMSGTEGAETKVVQPRKHKLKKQLSHEEALKPEAPATGHKKGIASGHGKDEEPSTGVKAAHVVYFNMDDDLENLDEDYRDPMYQNAAVYGDDVVDYGWFHMLSWIGFNLLLWMIIGASCFCGGVACAVFIYSFYYWVRKVQKRNSLSFNDIEQMA